MGLEKFLFGGKPAPGSNDPEISMFLANVRNNLTDEDWHREDKEELTKNYPEMFTSNLPEEAYEVNINEELDPRYAYDEPSMTGLLKYHSADADNTGVAHDNIDALLNQNKQDAMLERYNQSGSIGPTPVMSDEDLLDLTMGVAGPGMAIGRISKAAITGGQSRGLSEAGQWLKDFIRNAKKDIVQDPSSLIRKAKGGKHETIYGKEIKYPKAYIKAVEKNNIAKRKDIAKMEKEFVKEHGATDPNQNFLWNNKVNRSRIALEKAYDKYGIPHQGDMQGRQLMDPISERLRMLNPKHNRQN